jgi:ring-1,2-phenylacetyl-CoA epoxidase subunit PaaE
MAKFFPLRVKDVRRETADAVSVAFEVLPELKEDFTYIQGQYITLKLHINDEDVRRSYSICTSPYSENELRVAVKEVPGGKGSTYINRQMKAGDIVEVLTPMGNFHTQLDTRQKKNYILFAGGSGITPMMSIIKSILHVEPESSIVLFYANRNKESVIFNNELELLAAANKDRLAVTYIYDVSDDAKLDPIYKGLMTKEKVLDIVKRHQVTGGDEFFICGPLPMMDNIKAALLELNTDEKKIHIEYFSAVLDTLAEAEVAKDTGPVIHSKVIIHQYGMETEVELDSNGKAILDAALEAGLDAPFSCKGAVCCTCRAKVLEGKVRMTKNFALTPEEVAEGFVLTCQSHPITEKVVIDYDAM